MHIVLSVALALLLLGCVTTNNDSPTSDAASPTPSPTADSADAANDASEPDRPAIGEAAIEQATAHLEQEAAVQDGHIAVNGDAVVIAAQTEASLDAANARRLLENTARFLASQVAADTDGLDGPTADHLGDLWDHYRLQVVAGSDPNDPTISGAKSTASPRITW